MLYVTKGSQRFKRIYEMVKWLKCFWRFQVWKGLRTFWKWFRSLLKYLWPFGVRKGMGNSEVVPKWRFQNETLEAPEPLCGSQLNTVTRSSKAFVTSFSACAMGSSVVSVRLGWIWDEIGRAGRVGSDVMDGSSELAWGKMPAFCQQLWIVIVSTSFQASWASRMASSWSIS